MFTAQWNTGLPQWTLAVMHDAAAGSTEPSTPFIVGGGVILLAAVVGGGITAFVEKWLYRLPSFCAVVRFLPTSRSPPPGSPFCGSPPPPSKGYP